MNNTGLTVGQLIALLQQFPAEQMVIFSGGPNDNGMDGGLFDWDSVDGPVVAREVMPHQVNVAPWEAEDDDVRDCVCIDLVDQQNYGPLEEEPEDDDATLRRNSM
jgi:hypothetical protein